MKILLIVGLLLLAAAALFAPPVSACHEYGGSFGGSECFGGGGRGGDGGGPGDFWWELFNDFPSRRNAAAAWRDAGNEKFNRGDYAGALGDYEKARSIWGGRWIEENIATTKANLALLQADVYSKQGDQSRAIAEVSRALEICAKDYCAEQFRSGLASWLASARADLAAGRVASDGDAAWRRGSLAWGRRDWPGAEREFSSAASYYREALKRRPNDKALSDNLAYVDSYAKAARDKKLEQAESAKTAAGIQHIVADLAKTVSSPGGTAFFGVGGSPDVTLLPPEPDPRVRVTSTIEALGSAAESGKQAMTRPPEGAKEKIACTFATEACAEPASAVSVPRISGGIPPLQELIDHIPRQAWGDAEINGLVQWYAQREADKALKRRELGAVEKQIAANESSAVLRSRKQTLMNDLDVIERDQNAAKEQIKKRLVDRSLEWKESTTP